jgi:hypothetical protein
MIHWRFAAAGGIVLLVFDILIDAVFVLATQVYGAQRAAGFLWLYTVEAFIVAAALSVVAVRREYPPIPNLALAVGFERLWGLVYNVSMLRALRGLTAWQIAVVMSKAGAMTLVTAVAAAALVSAFRRPILRWAAKAIRPLPSGARAPDATTPPAESSAGSPTGRS